VLDVQFGNVWTNIPKPLFDELHIGLGSSGPSAHLSQRSTRRRSVVPYERTFGEVPIGSPLVYVNSLLNLAVALNQGSYAAAHKIDSGPDWFIELEADPAAALAAAALLLTLSAPADRRDAEEPRDVVGERIAIGGRMPRSALVISGGARSLCSSAAASICLRKYG
jgi:hypothetical protein